MGSILFHATSIYIPCNPIQREVVCQTLIVLAAKSVSWRLMCPDRVVVMSKLAIISQAATSVHLACCTPNIKAGVVNSDGCFVIQGGSIQASFSLQCTPGELLECCA